MLPIEDEDSASALFACAFMCPVSDVMPLRQELSGFSIVDLTSCRTFTLSDEQSNLFLLDCHLVKHQLPNIQFGQQTPTSYPICINKSGQSGAGYFTVCEACATVIGDLKMGVPNGVKVANGANALNTVSESNGVHKHDDAASEATQAEGSPKKRKRNRKKKKKKADVEANGHANGETQSQGETNGKANGHAHESERSSTLTSRRCELTCDLVANTSDTEHVDTPKANGHTIIPRQERPPTTGDDWDDVGDSIPVSMDQLLNGAKDGPETVESDPHLLVAHWIDNQTAYPPNSLSTEHRENITEHLVNQKFPGTTPNWPTTLRQTLWRAVIRPSYFWVNPETGEHSGKPKPIHRPDGIYENDFKVWLMCAAERADRIGRDLPEPEYVQRVESEVRDFLRQTGAEEKRTQFGHLVFLLMFDEEHKRGLRIEEVTERICRAFGEHGVNWDECGMFRPQEEGRKMQYSAEMADKMWREFVEADL
jgi:hypothetical protein